MPDHQLYYSLLWAHMGMIAKNEARQLNLLPENHDGHS